MKSAIVLWLLVAGVSYAAPLIDEPVAELRLKSGKVYRDAIAKSFSQATIFLKHADGGSSVKYEELPDTLAPLALAKRPAPPTAEQLAETAARIEKLRAIEAEQMKTRAADLERRKAAAAEAAAYRARNAETEARVAEKLERYYKQDVWINKVQMGYGDTLFVEFINQGDGSMRWDMRDVIGITKTGTQCNAIRVVSMNRTESLFDTMNIPAKSTKSYHITFDRPDGTYPRDMVWKR